MDLVLADGAALGKDQSISSVAGGAYMRVTVTKD